MAENYYSNKKKDDHIEINLTKDVGSKTTTRLDEYHFIHNALPEADLNQIDPSCVIFNRRLSFPILISSMTGGTVKGAAINESLAEVAQEFGIAMGLGSQRIGLEQSETMFTFNVRKIAPDILLMANLGAVQLNYGYSIEHCQKVVDAVNADALILHLNPLQEAIMENGDTRFSGLLKKIEQICRQIDVPVIAKEVGWGINARVTKKLVDAGITAVDIAGAGGTSWSQVEKFRTKNKRNQRIADAFQDWGISTVDALKEVRLAFQNLLVFASGGLKNGVDVAKCIALGANLGGVAGEFIRAAAVSRTELHEFTDVVTEQLRIAMFCVGARNLAELNQEKIQKFQGKNVT